MINLYPSAQDFFEEQQVHKPAVFLLRMILHDWSDEYCVKILRRLSAAAGPSTQLVVVDSIIGYACSNAENVENIPGAKMPLPPPPLLPNLGASGALPYFVDMQVSQTKNIEFFDVVPHLDDPPDAEHAQLCRAYYPSVC